MSRISISVSMNDGKPSVSLRTANAMGRQVPGYNIGTLLSEGRSTKKLEGKDRCEFNVTVCKSRPTLSFVINTTQHVPHVNVSSEQVLRTIAGIKAIKSPEKAAKASRNTSRNNSSTTNRSSSEPRRQKSSHKHRSRSESSSDDSHSRRREHDRRAPSDYHERNERSESLPRISRPKGRRYTEPAYEDEHGHEDEYDMPWRSSEKGYERPSRKNAARGWNNYDYAERPASRYR